MTKKILIADDDPAIVESTKMLLEMEGYDIDTTVDGETIYKMEKEYPDLLLLDIWMSGQDGREICKFLKKNPLTKHIPIVMISASRDIMKSAKEAGADDFLAKPFEMEDLLTKVKKFTD
jgi:CheY-like chemotaxis protein